MEGRHLPAASSIEDGACILESGRTGEGGLSIVAFWSLESKLPSISKR